MIAVSPTAAALRRHPDAPSLGLLAAELGFFTSFARGSLAQKRLARAYADKADGRPIMLVPGFLSKPAHMFVLRNVLTAAGHPVSDWGMGRNPGMSQDYLDGLVANLARAADRHGQKVTLIGWSLGGVYAREAAKRLPDAISAVLTLGTPFSGDPRANNAWQIYERVAGHAVDAPPVEGDRSAKPPVPTIALWSRRDGVIPPLAARGLDSERDQEFELPCGHMSLCSHPDSIATITRVLASLAIKN